MAGDAADITITAGNANGQANHNCKSTDQDRFDTKHRIAPLSE
jgi:hypothetical protein